MGISYKPLFRLLLERDMTRTDLRTELGFSSATLAKLAKGEPISGAVIEKLCTYFRCQVQDIVKITWEDTSELKTKKKNEPRREEHGETRR
jgi:DNA-binding Xre family transcriptional regulator